MSIKLWIAIARPPPLLSTLKFSYFLTTFSIRCCCTIMADCLYCVMFIVCFVPASINLHLYPFTPQSPIFQLRWDIFSAYYIDPDLCEDGEEDGFEDSCKNCNAVWSFPPGNCKNLSFYVTVMYMIDVLIIMYRAYRKNNPKKEQLELGKKRMTLSQSIMSSIFYCTIPCICVTVLWPFFFCYWVWFMPCFFVSSFALAIMHKKMFRE